MKKASIFKEAFLNVCNKVLSIDDVGYLVTRKMIQNKADFAEVKYESGSETYIGKFKRVK